jgi:ferredoxin
MKVVVDLNRCQGYGQCVYAAPNIFQLKGPEILAYDPAPPEQWRDEVEHAVHACPVRAIRAELDSPPVNLEWTAGQLNNEELLHRSHLRRSSVIGRRQAVTGTRISSRASGPRALYC